MFSSVFDYFLPQYFTILMAFYHVVSYKVLALMVNYVCLLEKIMNTIWEKLCIVIITIAKVIYSEGEWKFVLVEDMELYVMTFGTIVMHLLCAGN